MTRASIGSKNCTRKIMVCVAHEMVLQHTAVRKYTKVSSAAGTECMTIDDSVVRGIHERFVVCCVVFTFPD